MSVITNLAAPTRTTFLDLSARVDASGEGGLLGVAFHPGYATNGYFFVYYTLSTNTAAGSGFHDRLSRFQVSPDDPNLAPVDSELVLITQYDQAANHNGGDVHFGQDGYLYVSLGDEGGGGDTYGNGQRIDRDFFASILRLDVDSRPGSLPPNPHPAVGTGYSVPPDNPFVGATNFSGLPIDPAKVRTEFWAVGLRNPWRFSFDPPTGRLYCGDVGQGAWEEIDVIARGGNYGWNYREGFHPYTGTPPAGAVLLDPIWEYSHSGPATNTGYSVSGGLVYRGNRLAQLYGYYVFGDYGSGNIWALHNDGTNVTNFQLLTTAGRVVAFGTDPSNRDLLLVGIGGTIYRLVYSGVSSGDPLPATLADTGAFSDLLSLTPNPGVVPYSINVPFWSDNAVKSRWFSVPDTNQFLGFSPSGNWSFPTGTVWVKHFDLELTNGVAESRRRVETRFLVREPSGVYGLSYRWDDSQTNASLVQEDGRDEDFLIQDGGTVRTQVWRYPARSECLVCHTPVAGFALGFSTAQLNLESVQDGVPTNQVLALAAMGYFTNPPASAVGWPALAAATNETATLEHRSRSYLSANCVQCHQPGGLARGRWDARYETPLAQAGIVDGLLEDVQGDPANRVIAPGSVERSMIIQRLSELGPGHMPPLATSVINTQAISLLSRWVTQAGPVVPTITWPTPGDIMYGSPLTGAQLNASADTAGAFTYAPPEGTVFAAGTVQLLTHFVPTDTNEFLEADSSVLLKVLPAPLTITAEDKTMVYGQPVPALTVAYDGFVNGDSETNLSAVPTLGTTATSASPSGTYPIIVSSAEAANYTIRYVDGVLTVETGAAFSGVSAVGGTELTLSITGQPGRVYRLEVSSDLLSWAEAANVVAGPQGTAEVRLPIPSANAREFYRMVWP